MSQEKNKNTNKLIHDLEAKIRILEDENRSLAEEAEGTLLLSLISETLSQDDDIPTILENGLERIAVLKNIPFCCCGSLEGKIFTPVCSYIKYSDERNTKIDFTITSRILKKLDEGSGVFNLSGNKSVKLITRNDKNEFHHSFILLIPFSSRFIPNGIYIFADDNKADKLTGQSLILHQMVNMITERMDKIMLQAELKEINHQLEDRVTERTKELTGANEKLEKEIAERLKTEKALFLSESKFRSITEQLSDIIFLTDSNGCIKYISAASKKIFGFAPEEMDGKVFTEFLLESEITKALSAFTKCLKEGIDIKDLSLLMKKKDGSLFHGELDSTIFNGEAGKGTLGVIRDITERKEAEEEIKSTNLELTTLNKIISVSAHQLDSRILLDGALDEALKISGLDRGTVCMITPQNTLKLMVERNISAAVKQDLESNNIMVGSCLCGNSFLDKKPLILNSREEVLIYCSREVQRKEPIKFHATFPIIAKESCIGVLCVFTYTDAKPTGRNLKLIETLTSQISLPLENAKLYEEIRNNLVDLEEEITERKEVQEKLSEERNLLRTLIDNLPESVCIYIKDKKSRYLVNNLAHLHSLGCSSQEEVSGKTSFDFFPEESAKIYYDDEQVVIRTGKALLNKEEIVSKEPDDEQRWHLTSKVPLRDLTGKVTGLVGLSIDITERKKSEAILTESEERFRHSFEYSSAGICITGIDKKFQKINNAFKQMLGYTEAEIINYKMDDITYPEDIQLGNSHLQRMLDGVIEGVAYEKRFITKDKRIIWGYVNSSLIRDKNKNPQFIITQIVDITERRRAEEELLKLKKAVDTSGEAIFLTDTAGIFQYINPAFTSLYGFTAEEVVGKVTPRILKSGVLDTNVYVKFWETLNNLSEVRGELINKTKDGNYIDIEGSSSAILDEGKNIIGFIGIQRDITERKKAEKTIKESENLFRNMNNNSPMGMHFYELKEDNRLIFTGANPAADELLKVDNSQFIGMSIEEAFPPLIQTEIPQRYREAALNGTLWSTQQIIYNDGKIEGAFEVRAFQTSPGNMVAVFMDITERKKSEEMLRESEDRFRSLYENSTIGLYRSTPEGKILLANPTLIQMLGYSSIEELTERSLSEKGFEPSYDRKVFLDMMEKDGKIKGLESAWNCKDGSVIYIRESARAISDRDGKVLYYDGTVEDITERKKVEEALLESQEIFNQFMKHSPVYLFFKDENIRSLRLSDNFEKMLGKPVDDLIGKSMFDLFPSELAKKMVEDDQKILNEGKEVIVDEEFNGRHYTTIKFPIHVGGKPVYLAGFTLDVTERNKAEEEISMFANALKSIDECVTITDMDDTLLFCNQSFLNTYGYKKEEVIGKKMDILRSLNNDREKTDRILPETLSGGWSGELLNRRKDGSEFPIYLSTSSINDKDGNLLGLIGVAQDITERKKVEQEIISQKNKLEQLIIKSPVAIATEDLNGIIISVNNSFSNLFGYNSDEAVNRTLDSLVVSDEYKEEGYRLSEEMYSGKSCSLESFRKRKDGSLVFVQVVGVPIQIQGQVIGIYVMYVDLTHRMIAEQETIKSKEMAEQSDKLKSEFLAQMSHEIRTPINIIVSNLSFLREQLDSRIEPEDLDCFNSINLASQRMIRTIDLILNMSELQTGAYTPIYRKIDIDSNVLQFLYNEFQRTARAKGLELIYRNELTETVLESDEYSITQIFANLIDNAIKYTINGSIEIVLKQNHKAEVMVEIKDTGIGINKNFIPHLFEPFVQEEQGYTRSFEGNGLGLSLVKKYCEINNARIEVESEKNVGSVFKVIFGKKN